MDLVSLMAPSPVWAHVGELGPTTWGELARAWTFEPLVVLSLVVSAWIYRRGTQRLASRVSPGRGLRRWERACFWSGWWVLVIALVSPLHLWGQALFTAHMTQHELLMLVAAPLLVLGRPLVAFFLALPRADARQVSRLGRHPRLRRTWRLLTLPFVAWVVHAAALWVWHVPRFYEATLQSDVIHTLQHASFFLSALLFWWALLHSRASRAGQGVAILYLFTTMVHSGLLGALITFANTLIYPVYAERTAAWSLTPLEDQQLGGLIMWVPAGVVYILAAVALAAAWMRASDRRADQLLAPSRVVGGALLVLLLVSWPGCAGDRQQVAETMTGGSVDAGRGVIRTAGCGSCHTIPGVAGANGLVGPPLAGIASRNYIGGVLPNEPDNMIRWLLDPRSHSPRTVMPDVGLNEQQARHVAAYLYTLEAD